ncbi:MAG: diacylglycerol kinase family lipid kinase [Anaerolineae bacterium]|nr:diacylglycerol kinase family lipid kinase [Anaerolineae bacterium]
MRYKIIVNPISGKGFGARAVPKIEQLFAAHNLDFDLVCTEQAGQAISLARQAVLDGYDTVVAAGGDGTYQEVINGMLAADPDARTNGRIVGNLGILPVGSGCDFSWSIGISPDLETACAQLARGQTRRVDVVHLSVDGETRYFDNTLGIGFEGVVTVEARKIKYLRGIALYLPTVIKSIFVSLKSARSIIEYEKDGEMCRLEGAYLMIDVCNGGRAGGSFLVAPEAQAGDGLLDLILVKDIPRLRMLALVPHFLKGTHIKQPDVQFLRSKHITINSQDGLFAHADGEMICTDAHRIECEVIPQKLDVVC